MTILFKFHGLSKMHACNSWYVAGESNSFKKGMV